MHQLRWEASLSAVIGAVVVTLAVFTRLFGHPGSLDHTVENTSPISRFTPGKPLGSLLPGDLARPPPTKPLPFPVPRTAPRSARHPSQPPDPHQVVIGPNTISGRFILLASDRRRISLTSDELILHLRVVSLAAPNLVTPYQSEMLEVRAPGQAPIQPQDSFSRPVAAGNSREDEITFTIPATLSLDHSTLSIHYYSDAKEIPLNLPPRTDTHQR